MSRTSWRKVQYGVVLGAAAVLGLVLAWRFRHTPAMMFLLAVLFLLPGRLSGWLWRDLYRSLRLHDVGQYEAATQASQAFLDRLGQQPHLRRYWWLAWAVYTRDPKAMALNNLGASQLELGQLADAEESLRRALACDPEYPIPHYNLAVLSSLRQDPVAMQEHANTAIRLGYVRNAADRALATAGRMLASMEGRGQTNRVGS